MTIISLLACQPTSNLLYKTYYMPLMKDTCIDLCEQSAWHKLARFLSQNQRVRRDVWGHLAQPLYMNAGCAIIISCLTNAYSASS